MKRKGRKGQRPWQLAKHVVQSYIPTPGLKRGNLLFVSYIAQRLADCGEPYQDGAA